MASKRPTSKSSAPSSHPPLLNALLIGAAVAYGLWILVVRGRVEWPPHHLLSGAYTLAGCLALVGPFVLARSPSTEGAGLGELLWMTGGILVWTYDILGALRGEWRTTAWATPLGQQALGMAILAVLVAGWRCRLGVRNWSWTNVTGWALGLFWVGMALSTTVTGGATGLAAR
jgi:hypothetical protein